MKKILAVILAIVVLALISACQSTPGKRNRRPKGLGADD